MKRSRLMLWLQRGLLGVLVVLAVLLAWSYSWTFTDEGRMDYRAALMVRLISMQDQREFTMNSATRKRSNENTLKWLGEQKLYPVAEIKNVVVPGEQDIPVRMYVPKVSSEERLPIYLMIHGGGYWMGNDFRIEEPRARQIANLAEVIVLAVDYRLAPEHPYPAALEDCYAVLEWAQQHGADFGGDATRIGVGGGSAGGNLSAAVALKARDENGPPIKFLLLTMPSTDLSGDSSAKVPKARQLVLQAEHSAKMRDAYVPDVAMRRHAYVSPLLAPSHSNLPSTYVITGQFDPLRDQGEALAEKIEAAGNPVTLRRYPGVLHGFLGTPDVAEQAMGEAALAMKEVLHGG